MIVRGSIVLAEIFIVILVTSTWFLYCIKFAHASTERIAGWERCFMASWSHVCHPFCFPFLIVYSINLSIYHLIFVLIKWYRPNFWHSNLTANWWLLSNSLFISVLCKELLSHHLLPSFWGLLKIINSL